MTIPCLIDTNVLIDYLGGSDSITLVENFERALMAGAVVSVITTMELLGWRGHTADFKAIPGLSLLDPSHSHEQS